jgi:hypothetical protein
MAVSCTEDGHLVVLRIEDWNSSHRTAMNDKGDEEIEFSKIEGSWR